MLDKLDYQSMMRKYGAYTFQFSPYLWETERDNLRDKPEATKERLGLPVYAQVVSPMGGRYWEGRWGVVVPSWGRLSRWSCIRRPGR
jgi:hypothetical protein